jgi:hypothetical protein
MPCPADLLLPLPGYIYSLCPAAEALTEKCFQMMTLPFVGDTHTIRYLDNHTGQEQNKTKQNKTKPPALFSFPLTCRLCSQNDDDFPTQARDTNNPVKKTHKKAVRFSSFVFTHRVHHPCDGRQRGHLSSWLCLASQPHPGLQLRPRCEIIVLVFVRHLCIDNNDLFYQDRLGTNIGNAEKRDAFCDAQATNAGLRATRM